MRHEAALRRLDELDAGQAPGIALRMHLATCPSCARTAELTGAALRAYREARPQGAARLDGRPAGEGDRLLEERVMATLRVTPPPRQDFAMRDWLFPGAVILLSMCLLPLGSGIGFIESLFGPGSALYLSLVLGLAFTAYSALFIASHQAELHSYLQKRGLLPR
jgi:hypothetical protein